MLKSRRKLLSQNFLKGRELVKRLIKASDISRKDLVLDIGAGRGIITQSLLPLTKKVIAVEIDKSLFTDLSCRLSDYKNLELINGNFLSLDLPLEPYKVFSNIPFSITGEIIKKLLFSANPPDSCRLIVQKEAAEKFIVNQRKNSMLAILFYPWFEVKVSHTFKRTDFYPVPSVELCLLQIIKRSVSLVPNDSQNRYRDFVVFKFTKLRGASRRQPSQWLSSYTKDTHCRGFFHKWQIEQSKLKKIHRTRTDKYWRKFRK